MTMLFYFIFVLMCNFPLCCKNFLQTLPPLCFLFISCCSFHHFARENLYSKSKVNLLQTSYRQTPRFEAASNKRKLSNSPELNWMNKNVIRDTLTKFDRKFSVVFSRVLPGTSFRWTFFTIYTTFTSLDKLFSINSSFHRSCFQSIRYYNNSYFPCPSLSIQ